MYYIDEEVSETSLMQNNNNEDGFTWNLGPCSFKVTGLSNAVIQIPSII